MTVEGWNVVKPGTASSYRKLKELRRGSSLEPLGSVALLTCRCQLSETDFRFPASRLEKDKFQLL